MSNLLFLRYCNLVEIDYPTCEFSSMLDTNFDIETNANLAVILATTEDFKLDYFEKSMLHFWHFLREKEGIIGIKNHLESNYNISIIIQNNFSQKFNLKAEKWQKNSTIINKNYIKLGNFNIQSESIEIFVTGLEINANPYQKIFINTLLLTFESYFKMKLEENKIRTEYKNTTIFDLLNNNIESEQYFIEQAYIWGIQATENVQVMLIDSNSQNIILDIGSICEQQKTSFLTYPKGEITTLLLFYNEANIDTSKLIAEKIVAKHHLTRIGIGRKFGSVLSAYRSYQEAELALEMISLVDQETKIIDYNSLGYIRLLSYIHSDLLMQFAKQQLSPLLRYDNENSISLLETLTCYCANNGNIPATASALFLHQNSLRNRLKKIEEIMRIDLGNYFVLTNMMISIKILQIEE